MMIKSTNDYLKILDDIAKIVEKDNPSQEELKDLQQKQAAVRAFELKEVKKYPAQEMLVGNLFKAPHSWN